MPHIPINTTENTKKKKMEGVPAETTATCCQNQADPIIGIHPNFKYELRLKALDNDSEKPG